MIKYSHFPRYSRGSRFCRASLLAAAGVLTLAGCASFPGAQEAAFSPPPPSRTARIGAVIDVHGEGRPVTVTGHYVAASGEECIRYTTDAPALACRAPEDSSFVVAGMDMTTSAALPSIAPAAGDFLPALSAHVIEPVEAYVVAAYDVSDTPPSNEGGAVPAPDMDWVPVMGMDRAPGPSNVRGDVAGIAPVAISAVQDVAMVPVVVLPGRKPERAVLADAAPVIEVVPDDVVAVSVAQESAPVALVPDILTSDSLFGRQPVSAGDAVLAPAATSVTARAVPLSSPSSASPGSIPSLPSISAPPADEAQENRPALRARVPLLATRPDRTLAKAVPAHAVTPPRRILPPPGSVSLRHETAPGDKAWNEASVRPAFHAAAKADARL